MNLAKLNESLRRVAKLLSETRYALSNQDFFAFISDKSATPLAIFVGIDAPIQTAKNFYVFKINSAQFKKERNEGIFNGSSSARDLFIQFYEDFADKSFSGKRLIDNLKVLGKLMPKVFLSSTKVDRKTAYKLITTDYKTSDKIWTTNFGDIPEGYEKTAAFKVGDSPVTFPEGVKESSIEAMQELITTVYKTFKKNGIPELMTGQVRFSKSMGTKLGLYSLDDHNITISYKAKDNDKTLEVIFHEYAHKWMYEFIPTKMKSIEEMFFKLSRTGNYKNTSTEEQGRKDLSAKIMKVVKVGDVLVYSGKKNVFKGDWVLRKIENDKIYFSRPDSDHIGMGGHPHIFANGQWKSKNKKLNTLLSTGIAAEMKAMDDWFPSVYSTTSAVEWYAELFAHYMLGKVKGDPKDFIKKTLK